MQNQLIDLALSYNPDGENETIWTPGVDDSVTGAVSTEDLIASGESKYIEFKQTGRINLHTQERDPIIEHEVIRAIAGFMNAEGGTLLIGVTDAGEVFGIETDFKTLGRKQSPDGFSLWLDNFLDNTLGPVAAADVKLQFTEFPDGTVCRVDVSRRSEPTYVKDNRGGAIFYIRRNNVTRHLNTAETVEYLRTRRF